MGTREDKRGDKMGRPRDPAIDRKVEQAAVQVFGELGTAGFSIEKVSKSAGVGKASIYLRWSSGEHLLAEAMASVFKPIAHIDNGNLRADLRELALVLLNLYGGPNGLAARRIALEADTNPALAEHWASVRTGHVRITRAILRRARERGELVAGVKATLIADTLCGAAMLHPVATPAELRPSSPETNAQYARNLVDFVLTAAQASGTAPEVP
jgi:AcrR family transcriptional regulator